jgi:hypothetical protein
MPQRRIRGAAYRRVAHAARARDAIAWAKLRSSAQIIPAVPGNFAHPTPVGFIESIR